MEKMEQPVAKCRNCGKLSSMLEAINEDHLCPVGVGNKRGGAFRSLSIYDVVEECPACEGFGAKKYPRCRCDGVGWVVKSIPLDQRL